MFSYKSESINEDYNNLVIDPGAELKNNGSWMQKGCKILTYVFWISKAYNCDNKVTWDLKYL